MRRFVITLNLLTALSLLGGCATGQHAQGPTPSRAMLVKSDVYAYEFKIINLIPMGGSFLVTASPVGQTWVSGPLLTADQVQALCTLYSVQTPMELKGKHFYARRPEVEHAEPALEELAAHAQGRQQKYEAEHPPR